MKNSIFIAGISAVVLMLLGCTFKMMHWPGAAIMIILSVAIFCLLFLPGALLNSFKNQESKKYRALHLITFLVFFISMTGVLFKVMHWPGAGVFLLIGLPLPFVLFLPVYLYATRERSSTEVSETKNKNLNFLGIMFGLTFLAVFSVLLAITPSRQLIERTASDTEEHKAFSNFLVNEGNPSNSAVSKAADELCIFIDQLYSEMLNPNGTIPNEGDSFDAHSVRNPEEHSIPKYVLSGKDEHEGKLPALKLKINNFHDAIVQSSKLNPDLRDLSDALLSTADIHYTNEHGERIEMRWEDREFPTYRLIFVLDYLAELKSNVRLVEHEFNAL